MNTEKNENQRTKCTSAVENSNSHNLNEIPKDLLMNVGHKNCCRRTCSLSKEFCVWKKQKKRAKLIVWLIPIFVHIIWSTINFMFSIEICKNRIRKWRKKIGAKLSKQKTKIEISMESVFSFSQRYCVINIKCEKNMFSFLFPWTLNVPFYRQFQSQIL